MPSPSWSKSPYTSPSVSDAEKRAAAAKAKYETAIAPPIDKSKVVQTTPDEKTETPKWKIGAAVAGGVVGIGLIGWLTRYLIRRKK